MTQEQIRALELPEIEQADQELRRISQDRSLRGIERLADLLSAWRALLQPA